MKSIIPWITSAKSAGDHRPTFFRQSSILLNRQLNLETGGADAVRLVIITGRGIAAFGFADISRATTFEQTITRMVSPKYEKG
jgi:hypothetical protein